MYTYYLSEKKETLVKRITSPEVFVHNIVVGRGFALVQEFRTKKRGRKTEDFVRVKRSLIT